MRYTLNITNNRFVNILSNQQEYTWKCQISMKPEPSNCDQNHRIGFAYL